MSGDDVVMWWRVGALSRCPVMLCISVGQEPFISACVSFLKRRCPQLMGVGKDEPQTKSQQLPPDTIITMLHCLKQFSRLVADSPEGRPGISGVSPLSGISGLSVWSHFSTSPLLFFCLILLLFLPYPCLLLAHSPDFFFPKPPFSEW